MGPTIHVEPFESCWPEVKGLFARCLAEMGRPYNPDEERYRDFALADGLFIVCVRQEGELVGFAVMYVFRSMHDQSLQAQEDVFYLLPEHRRGWTAARLLRAVEDEVRRRGCVEVNMQANSTFPAGFILSARDYAITSSNYRKTFPRADSPPSHVGGAVA